MAKERVSIRQECEDCGKEPVIDTEKSTDNWTVYSTTCTYCGGRVRMIIE